MTEHESERPRPAGARRQAARHRAGPRTRHAELLILCARIGFNP